MHTFLSCKINLVNSLYIENKKIDPPHFNIQPAACIAISSQRIKKCILCTAHCTRVKALIRDALLNGWDFSFFLNHFPLFCLTVFLYITIIIIIIRFIFIISNFFSMIFYKLIFLILTYFRS